MQSIKKIIFTAAAFFGLLLFTLPAYSKSLPANAQSLPANTQSFPANAQSLPANAQSLPADSVEVDPEELALKADTAYTCDNFRLAEQLYLQAMAKGDVSSALYYNIGNTYYRQGNLGKAIVYYERALRLDPTNSDARTNLEFVNSKITDRQVDSGSYMQSVWHGALGMMRADTWAIVALVLFAIFLGAVAVYVFSSAVTAKKAGFFGGIIVFVLTVAAVIFSFAAANRINDHHEAIILPPSTQLSTSPREARDPSEQAFLLHEGTKVEIIDSVSNPGEGKWYEVIVGHGDRAWIRAQDIEQI